MHGNYGGLHYATMRTHKTQVRKLSGSRKHVLGEKVRKYMLQFMQIKYANVRITTPHFTMPGPPVKTSVKPSRVGAHQMEVG